MNCISGTTRVSVKSVDFDLNPEARNDATSAISCTGIQNISLATARELAMLLSNLAKCAEKDILARIRPQPSVPSGCPEPVGAEVELKKSRSSRVVFAVLLVHRSPSDYGTPFAMVVGRRIESMFIWQFSVEKIDASSASAHVPPPAANPSLRSDLLPPRMAAPMLEVNETTRILRATHEFGVLGDLLCATLPNDRRVEEMHVEALRRVDMATASAARFGRPASSADMTRRARERLRIAYESLRQPSLRRLLHRRLVYDDAGVRLPTPVTSRVRCPIDVSALTLHAIVWCHDGVPLGAAVVVTSDAFTRHLNDRTVADVVAIYLQQHVTVPSHSENGIGYVDLAYRHGARTAALVAAGWLTGGRERATGDPFSELCTCLRRIALRRFGYDFDDAAAYPRAALHAIVPFRHLAGMLLRGDNRECIMRWLGAKLLPSLPVLHRRAEVKLLINLLDMDGTYGGWRLSHGEVQAGAAGPGWPALPGCPSLPGPALLLPSGEVFEVRRYFREQTERTVWVGLQRPHLTALYDWWRQSELNRRDWKDPSRTLKSDMLAEYEFASRGAKRWWADMHGHFWLSLQHDGVVMALVRGTLLAEALRKIETCLTAVLGYHQPVELKSMDVAFSGALLPPVLSLPPPSAPLSPSPLLSQSAGAPTPCPSSAPPPSPMLSPPHS